MKTLFCPLVIALFASDVAQAAPIVIRAGEENATYLVTESDCLILNVSALPRSRSPHEIMSELEQNMKLIHQLDAKLQNQSMQTGFLFRNEELKNLVTILQDLEKENTSHAKVRLQNWWNYYQSLSYKVYQMPANEFYSLLIDCLCGLSEKKISEMAAHLKMYAESYERNEEELMRFQNKLVDEKRSLCEKLIPLFESLCKKNGYQDKTIIEILKGMRSSEYMSSTLTSEIKELIDRLPNSNS